MRILDLAGLAVALAVASPVVLFGAERLLAGDPLGLVYVGLGAAVIGVHHLLTTPSDVPGRVLQGLVGAAVERPDDDGED